MAKNNVPLQLLIFLLLVLACVTLFAPNTIPKNHSPIITKPSSSSKPSLSHSHDHKLDIPHHPLDPLTVVELIRIKSIIKNHMFSKGFKSYILNSVVLLDPPKSRVLRWKEGDSLPPRKASVISRVNGENHVLTVNLRLRKVEAVKISRVAGYPTLTNEERLGVMDASFRSIEFNKSIIQRGVDPADLSCDLYTPGWFGKNEANRRIIKIQCFSTVGTSNFYLRPIEGITVVVDVDTKEIISISDIGKTIPIPNAANTDYRVSNQTKPHPNIRPINPISMEQPKGPSFIVENGHIIKWANWEFHLRPDPRAGVVLSRVRVIDPESGELRSVMYKGMVSELFVPYMDPTEAWYFKAYMDAGEYGFGLSMKELDPINDCPRNAYYMDGVFGGGDGSPFVLPNVICVFERHGAGDIAWRHTEDSPNEKVREVRPKVTLIVRMVAVVGNYDYIIDWELQTDGLIKVKVSLSGIAVVKGTSYTHVDQVPEHEDLYGTLVLQNRIGATHDHYVTFYMDMDVDGSSNSFVNVNMQKHQNSPSELPRKSYMKVVKNIAKTEKDAQIKLKIYYPSEFHVVNQNKKTDMGNLVGYKLVPAGNAASLLDLEDSAQMRAAFTNNQIWVTPYNESEIWAGGLFIYQSQGDDNLATWSNKDRPIENKDIVVWYTVGFHHIPCQEDFPVMPIVTSHFDLKPVNFFNRNPIISMHPYSEKDLPVCTERTSI